MLNGTYKNLLTRISVRYANLKYKHKSSHWSVQVKKKTATTKALEHFDDFYQKVYGKLWNSVRKGLVEEHKYVAIINNYSDSEKTITRLENAGALNMRTLFNLEKEYINDKQVDNNGISSEEILQTTTEELIKEQMVQVETEQLNEKVFEVNSLAASLKNAKLDTSRIIYPGTADASAILYEFVPATKLKGKEDWIPETQYYKYYEDTSDFSVKIEKEYDLHFPENLNVYCFEKSNHTRFDEPRKGVTDVYDYYLLDGGSLLPVLALGIKPGDTVIDTCAAPGGKSIIALQTLYPKTIVCNDVDFSRVKRIHNVMKQYLYDLDSRWLQTGRLRIAQEDARLMATEKFDRVLVDVPCTNDRLSVRENDNNWFKSSRTKERLQLPEIQAAILINALKLVRIGGTLVYSTCSLSPIQNDGVVSMALKQIWEETNLEFVVKDLSPALEAAKCCFRFADQNILRYGHLVLPYFPQNYGPMYFCKLERKK